MQTKILKHVQVFVVITFEIFQIFFWDRGVGGWGQLYPNFFWIFGFFYIYKVPKMCMRNSIAGSVSRGAGKSRAC